MMGLALETS